MGHKRGRNRVQRRFKARVAAGKSGLTGGAVGTSSKGKNSTLGIYRANQRQSVQQAAAARTAAAEAAKKAEATRKNKFDPNRLGNQYTGSVDASAFTGSGLGINDSGKFSSSRVNTKTRYSNKDYLTATPYKEAFRRTFFGDGLQGNRFNPADRIAAQGAGLVDSGINLFNSFKNMGEYGVLGFGKKIPNVPTLPKFQDTNLQALRNFSSVAIPAAFTGGAASRLSKVGLGQEIGQMTLRNAAFRAGVTPTLTKTGITGVSPLTIGKAFTPGMLKTGPTAGASAAILGTATALKAGGLNTGESSDDTGPSTSDVFSPNSKFRLARTITPRTPRDKNINYDIPGIAKDALLGTLDRATFNKFDFDNLGRPGDDKTFTDKFNTFKESPLQQAVFSAQTGLDAKRVINEGESAAKEIYNNYLSRINTETAQTARRPIAQLLRDTAGKNQTDATAMVGRSINALTNNAENFSDDPNALTRRLQRFNIPQLSDEDVQDLRHTFDKSVTEDTGVAGKSLTNVSYGQALGFANRITSGKVKDGVVESMGQLGLTNIPSLDDAVAVGQQFKDNLDNKDSTTAIRMKELDDLYKRYGPGGGQAPTTRSLFKGLGRGGGGGRSGLRTSTGGQQATQVPTVQPIPVSPTTADPDIKSITQEAYQKRLAQLKQLTPLPPVVQQTQRPATRFNFRTAFNRDYFA